MLSPYFKNTPQEKTSKLSDYLVLSSLNQTWVHLPRHRKANLLTPVESAEFIAGTNKESGSLWSKVLNSRQLQGRGFRDGQGGSCRMHDQIMYSIRLVGIKVKFQASSTLWFQLVQGLCACGHQFSPDGDLLSVKIT